MSGNHPIVGALAEMTRRRSIVADRACCGQTVRADKHGPRSSRGGLFIRDAHRARPSARLAQLLVMAPLAQKGFHPDSLSWMSKAMIVMAQKGLVAGVYRVRGRSCRGFAICVHPLPAICIILNRWSARSEHQRLRDSGTIDVSRAPAHLSDEGAMKSALECLLEAARLEGLACASTDRVNRLHLIKTAKHWRRLGESRKAAETEAPPLSDGREGLT